MSRGFVKEEDQEDIPFVPPRAHLPENTVNYVTQVGLDALLKERKGLIKEKANLSGTSDNELRISRNFINAKILQLDNRIASAKVVDLNHLNKDEVRFGALITLKDLKTTLLRKFQIVGVDEADIAKEKISFLSPLAKTVVNKKIGDRVQLKLPENEVILEIISIEY
ncbi:MAG: GreA/GreB family elongation factor [Altibacter sp.]|uniref:GreA/GreB family elongation factor n=1 Tax=Altibacter sp. TaxID=2024823 RepID=UPI001DFD71BF|nr:GreA/GreB family elongation factor [Altibacter sp.]MBZ0327138.1 GreA/GreB family elongation factor [Altibacter sp.]